MSEELEWYKEINPEELPPAYRDLSKLIGIENTFVVAKHYQGTGLYLPKLDGVLADLRNKKIKREFNGGNYKELAIKYGLTERWVREIVGVNECDNQISIFDTQQPDNA